MFLTKKRAETYKKFKENCCDNDYPTYDSVVHLYVLSFIVQICEILEDNSTRPQWLDDVGVPVLIRGTEFIAFENERSARIKVS